MQTFPEWLDVTFKAIEILLSSIGIFQLSEIRKRRNIDMYWKIYEIYTSDIQKNAMKETIKLRKIIGDKWHQMWQEMK